MPIRWRLTVWYTGILLGILVILGSSVYFLLQYSLTTELERNLESKADEVLRSTKVVGTLPFFLRQVVLPDVEVFAAPDVYLQVVARNGEVAAKSNNLGNYNLPVSGQIVEEVLRGESTFATFSVENEKLKMVVKPLLLDGEIVGILQVARPLKTVSHAMVWLRRIMAIGGLASLAVSLVLGWFMSKKTLAPINDLTREAKTIGEERDFKRRVDYSGPMDELGELAVTFNSMLERLEEAYRRLSGLLQAQQRFVADASHELRTPLTSIQGNVDFLLQVCQEETRLEPFGEVLNDISAETKRLSRLVRELLTLARADAGLNISLVRVELLPALEEAVRQARHLVKDQDFDARLEEARGLAILADPDYFKQMLLIFLDNAFKYTPPGKKVTFEVRKMEEEKMIALVFHDEGPGIAESDVPHIFERFYRAQSSRTGEGTGLGLAIARWITAEHRGNITVESEMGKGTAFSVFLPLF